MATWLGWGAAWAGAVQVVQDPSFEQGYPNPSWDTSASTAGDPITSAGWAGARSGVWYILFPSAPGGAGYVQADQEVTLPAGMTVTLRLYVQAFPSAPGGRLDLLVDTAEVFHADASNPAYQAGYTEVTVDLTALADGAPHLLSIRGEGYAYEESFAIDDVTIETGPLASACDGGLAWDDGTYEGYAWLGTNSQGTFLLSFTPPSYPYRFDVVCVAWTQSTGDTGVSYNAVAYWQDVRYAAPASATGIPSWPGALFSAADVWGDFPVITDGSVYIGAEWVRAGQDVAIPIDADGPGGAVQQFIDENGTWHAMSSSLTLLIRAHGVAGQASHASFTWSPPNPVPEQPVQFTDTSAGSPTSWSWDFGDGGTSTAQNPSHAYAAVGSFTVTLTVANDFGSDTANATVAVGVPPDAAFSWAPTSPGPGEVVQFSDQSTGDPTSWSWDFGDGASGSGQHPTHAYGEPGTYAVTLTAANPYGTDQVSHPLEVRAGGLHAAFAWSPQMPYVGETVAFVDRSSGDPTSWSWDFGDGSGSSLQNPLHTYAAQGRFIVTLTVAGDGGSHSSDAALVVLEGTVPEGGGEVPVAPSGTPVGEQVATAVDPSGNRVVVWREPASGAKNGLDGIFGRVFGSGDQPLGGTFPVASGAAGSLGDPTVAVDAEGDFFVGWGVTGGDGGILGRLFTADQTPVGESFRLDEGGSHPSDPEVAASNGGELAVVWTDTTAKSLAGEGIFARAFGADGQPRGPAVRVDPGTAVAISPPAVAADVMGNFVVAWSQTDVAKGNGGDGVFGALFNARGEPAGAPVLVSEVAAVEVKEAAVGRAADGTTVVVWSQDSGTASGWDVVARRLDPSGQALGGQFRVNAGAEGTQERPAVAVNPAGDFAVAWESRAAKVTQGRDGVFGAFFDREGERLGPDFEVAVPIGGVVARFPATELANDDAVTVAYTRVGPSGPQGVTFRTFPVESAPGECDEGPTALCLNQDRFRVEVVWRDFEDGTGVGEAVALTDDTGYFWFFDPANVEVVVKVLDGRWLNGHFWVFYGALSNVEFAITVTDTETGASVTYHNPMGNFASVGDTEAIPGSGKSTAQRAVEAPLGLVDPDTAALYTELARAGSAAAVASRGDCTPGPTSLCLNQTRFRVEVTWRAFDGTTGVGEASPLTSDTGCFWFFDDANLELIVKVLDGRWLNGHFWVFYGALSNVEYTITVTDTDAGEQRVYLNPMGEFGSVGDTGAFLVP